MNEGHFGNEPLVYRFQNTMSVADATMIGPVTLGVPAQGRYILFLRTHRGEREVGAMNEGHFGNEPLDSRTNIRAPTL